MDVEYLKQDVAAALEEGLATVVKYQPDDQVEFLGQYLLKYVNNKRAEAQAADARAARERTAKAAASRRNAESKQKEIADAESEKLAGLASDLAAALAAGTETEPDDLIQKVVDAVQAFTGATGAYVGEKDPPETEEEKLCVRYIAATADHSDMLGSVLQEGSGFTLDAWKLPEKTDEDEDAGDEDGEAKVEKPPAFTPVDVRNVLLTQSTHFFRRPSPGAFFGVPIRYKSSLYDGSITDDAVEAFNQEVATVKAAIAEAEEKKAAAEAAAAEAAAAAEEKGDAEGDEGEDTGKEAEAAAPAEPAEPLPQLPRMPKVATRDVDLVLCVDTLGQGRPFTEAEKKAALEWGSWLGKSLEALELQHATEDWDAFYAAQQANEGRASKLEEKAGDWESNLQAKLAEISEDLSDEAKASAAAKVNLWAAKEKLEDIEDMIYELRNRRVAPKATPMKVLQAVVYIAGHKHSELVDPYARKKNQIAWKKMRRVFDSKLYRNLRDFDAEASSDNGKHGEEPYLSGLVEGLVVEDLRKSSVAVAVLLEWLQAALAARRAVAAEAVARAEAEAAAREAAEAEEAARLAAEAEAEAAGDGEDAA